MTSSLDQRSTPPGPAAPFPSAPTARTRSGGAPRRVRDRLAGAGFLAPAVLLVAVPALTRSCVTLYRGFFSDGRVSSFTWFSNYGLFFSDPVLAKSIENTLMWVVGTVALPLVLGLGISVHDGRRPLVTLGAAAASSCRTRFRGRPSRSCGTSCSPPTAPSTRSATLGLDSFAQGWLLDLARQHPRDDPRQRLAVDRCGRHPLPGRSAVHPTGDPGGRLRWTARSSWQPVPPRRPSPAKTGLRSS